MIVVTVYAVSPTPAEAEHIGRAIIEERLAACTPILAPGCSIYWWKSYGRTRPQSAALFKTTLEKGRRADRPHNGNARL